MHSPIPGSLVLRLLLLLMFILGCSIVLRDHSIPDAGAIDLQAALGPHPVPFVGKNRLGTARGHYLRAAASQPVWWFAWGPEPFLVARALHRPILLDIGADWCHWCHVMDRATYMDSEVATLINAHFVAIKVDRDARPDIDRRYQVAVRAIANTAGWPLTAFLTPNGDVYFGGSMFAARGVDNQLGLIDLLPRLAEAFQREGSAIQQAALFLREQLRRYLMLDSPAGRLDPRHIEHVAASAASAFDQEHGGLTGDGMKFPDPMVWHLLLAWNFYDRHPRWRSMTELTLQHMAAGGVNDQLGGGFHHYATDALWHTPRFEKILSTNALLGQLYLDAFAVTKNESYRDVAEGIAQYILATLWDPVSHLFFDHQDADSSGGLEGDYYTWSKEELTATLNSEERQVAILAFGIQDVPRDLTKQPARNVLIRTGSDADIAQRLGWTVARVAEVLQAARAKLLLRRTMRLAPSVEPAAYASTNGMAIHALFRGAAITGRSEWRNAGVAALDKILAEGWNASTGVARGWIDGHWDPAGLLADQAWIFTALLDAYELIGAPIYLERAVQLAVIIERRFADPNGGGFFDRPTTRPSLLMAEKSPPLGLEEDGVKSYFDQNEPADNPVIAMAYDRLAVLTGNPEWRTTADGILLSLAGIHPDGVDRTLASYAEAVLYHLHAPAHVVIVGPADDPVVRGLANVARQSERLHTIVQVIAPGDAGNHPLPSAVQAQVAASGATGRPLAFLCVGAACAPPTPDPSALDHQLRTWHGGK